MGYLDEDTTQKLFTPPTRMKSDEERQVEWQNEGHVGITEDFSGDKTPQERADELV